MSTLIKPHHPKMEQVRFNYSMKNIPIPPKDTYLKRLIEKVESVIKRMRWKAFFFDQNTDVADNTDETDKAANNKFGFKSRKCPPQNEEMIKFEADLLHMVKNVQFRNVNEQFQNKLNEDTSNINKSTKSFIPADKTTNFYKLDKTQHDNLLRNNITTTYKKANTSAYTTINLEAQAIAAKLKIEDRTETTAKQQAFITLKDHKQNFENNPTCRLINPAKSDLGMVSKSILDNINTSIRQQTSLNQWRNTTAAINWFNNIPEKSKHSFTVFDIDNFYPSISENLLLNAIEYAKKYINITNQDLHIIMHCRKSLLFDNDIAWVKKNNNNMFDITMGSYDGAEICELVGLFLLDTLSKKYGLNNIGLYRDDGLALFKQTSGPQAERTRKEITKTFKNHGLSITIQSNLKIVNFLDVTLNLTDGTHYPYRKPNNETQYIDIMSNHPPTILKQLPAAIGLRISEISSNEEMFNKSKPHYEDALKKSGHNEKLQYSTHSTPTPRRRQRQIIWFNPPFSKNVATNVGKTFLHLTAKHFPASHRYHKIFNKNTIKVSYSCMDNMSTFVKKHNHKVLNPKTTTTENGCNCRSKKNCPLDNNCLSPSLVYKASVTTKDDTAGKIYIGLTEGTFKQRYNQHTLSLRNKKYANSTELSKHIWTLKDNKIEYTINWSILTTAAAYNNKAKRCNLCSAEKFYIIKADNSTLLNKRSELISKCRHENKYYLSNFKVDPT